MEIYWSWKTILLYITIMYIIIILFGRAIKLKEKRDKSRFIYYFIAYIIMIIFACTRSIGNKIGGTDSLNYISFFENSLKPVKFNLLYALTFKRR